jgi:hypothetical protein
MQMAATRITVTLEEDQYVGLEEVAADRGVSLSDAARLAINAYLLGEHWGATVGETAREAIRAGMTNAEALEAVRERFPHAKTTPASIAWYRSQLRREDPHVKTDAQARYDRG